MCPSFRTKRGGFAYEPGLDHPLLIPTAGDARPNWTLEDFKRAVNQAQSGRIAVLQFHGVPDLRTRGCTPRLSDSRST